MLWCLSVCVKIMKLIYIVNARIPTEKAHGLQIIRMCDAFASVDGLEVELVVPKRDNPIKEDAFRYYNLKNKFKITHISCSSLIRDSRIGIFLEKITFLSNAVFYAMCQKSDIWYNRSSLFVYFMAKILGKKTGIEFHEPPRRFLFFKKRLMRHFDKMIVVPYRIADLYREWGIKEENILISPNGVDLEIFDINITRNEALEKTGLTDLKNKKILCYTGSFKTKGEEKGIRDILKAMRELGDDIVFVAAGGDDSDIEYYRKQAQELNIDDRVYLFGRKKQSDLAVYQKGADCLLMPFPDIAHYRLFMTPMKMFEYMASKRPVISSDLPSVRKILNEKNCLFCHPGDHGDLANKIKKLFDDNVFAENIADQAFRDVQEYTWDKRAKNIIDFIKK